MTLFPNDGFKITCTSADKQGRFTQFYSIEISPKTWEKDLSHARTFCFYEEIEFLIKKRPDQGRQPGKRRRHPRRRGADDRAAALPRGICPAQDAGHRRRPVAAAAGRLRGHLIAVKPSHAANCELARLVTAQMRKPLRAAQTFAPPPDRNRRHPRRRPARRISLNDGDTLDMVQIMKFLPHRYPFLMVDRVTKIEGNKITA